MMKLDNEQPPSEPRIPVDPDEILQESRDDLIQPCSSDSNQEKNDNSSDLENESTKLQLDSTLVSMGESPVKFTSKLTESYVKEKFERSTHSLKRKFEAFSKSEIEITTPSYSEKEKAQLFDKMIYELKEKVRNTTVRAEKITVLTLTSKIWSQRKNSEEFNVSRYTSKVAHNIAEEKGILNDPNPRQGHKISDIIVNDVHKFYKSCEVSRIMPGKKDKVTVVRDGVKSHAQKHLILCNLKEAYHLFK